MSTAGDPHGPACASIARVRWPLTYEPAARNKTLPRPAPTR